jgi:hypothetical protein
MGVQSDTSSSSTLEPTLDTERNADIGTPGAKGDTGSATEKSDQFDNTPPSDPERLDRKDNSPLVQPEQDAPNVETEIIPDQADPIHEEDADATLRPVEPIRPDLQVP